MDARRSGFPGCCQAGVVHDFNYDEKPTYAAEAEMVKDTQLTIPSRGYRVEFATTTPVQKSAEVALKKAGFVLIAKSGTNHGRYKIAYWMRGDATLEIVKQPRGKRV